MFCFDHWSMSASVEYYSVYCVGVVDGCGHSEASVCTMGIYKHRQMTLFNGFAAVSYYCQIPIGFTITMWWNEHNRGYLAQSLLHKVSSYTCDRHVLKLMFVHTVSFKCVGRLKLAFQYGPYSSLATHTYYSIDEAFVWSTVKFLAALYRIMLLYTYNIMQYYNNIIIILLECVGVCTCVPEEALLLILSYVH